MKIVVLAGGLSPERNVSLSSGAMICQALRQCGHRVALIDLFYGTEGRGVDCAERLFEAEIPESYVRIDSQAPNLKHVKAQRDDKSESMFGPGVLELCASADIVFLALHGTCGEDGRVQATFDLMGIPYTGSDYRSSALALDKDMTKRLVTGCPAVTTPEWETVDCTCEPLEQIADRTLLPAVVKPLSSGSSIGVYIVRTKEELIRALEVSRELGGKTVVEQFIQGREFSVGVLEDQALPAIEIIPKVGFYDYENKYASGATTEICPADIPPAWEESMKQSALEVFRALGLSVYSRADFIVAADGTAYFLEINTLPGMTPTSLMPQEAAAVGIDYPQLCERIICASLKARRKEYEHGTNYAG